MKRYFPLICAIFNYIRSFHRMLKILPGHKGLIAISIDFLTCVGLQLTCFLFNKWWVGWISGLSWGLFIAELCMIWSVYHLTDIQVELNRLDEE